MTDQPPIERDATGRFVKQEQPETVRIDDSQSHPMARVFFGWVEHRRTPLFLLVAVIAICAGLILVDLTLHRHEYIELANATGFYGLWGFGAFAFAVLSGWPLARLLRRSEDYYGEAETTPQDVEAEQ